MNWYIAGAVALFIWLNTQRKSPPTISGLGGNHTSGCPRPTQDLALNTKNRNSAIKAPHIQYGPLNMADQSYWKRMAKHWGTTTEVAKKSRCSNCVAFDISPRMEACMPGEVSSDAGRLGYCWMHAFKCASARSCYTWASGGPITTNTVSYDWQSRATH